MGQVGGRKSSQKAIQGCHGERSVIARQRDRQIQRSTKFELVIMAKPPRRLVLPCHLRCWPAPMTLVNPDIGVAGGPGLNGGFSPLSK